MKTFLGVFYEWGPDEKGSFVKITMEKNVKKLVIVYKKLNERDFNVSKNQGAPVTTLSKSKI